MGERIFLNLKLKVYFQVSSYVLFSFDKTI